jgi:pimeloyl-ACP methyl ester carboxylesterase
MAVAPWIVSDGLWQRIEPLLPKPPHSKLDLVDAGHFTWEDAADQYGEIVTGWWAGGHARV